MAAPDELPLTPEQWARVKDVFATTMMLPADARKDALDRALGDAGRLRAEVESLLEAHDQAGTFIDAPAPIPASVTGARREGATIGAYRIERELGHGGMGAVYLAVRADDAFRKRVAIKVIKRGMDTDEIVGRFRRERQTLANLDHPNIGRLLDGGTTDDGLPYFVLEYVDGRPLDVYCDESGLDVAARLRLFRIVCGAVRFAHRNLVVHRDLKPDNILVTADGTPKLLDFGIAKVLTADPGYGTVAQTRPAQRMMTLSYASPEQLLSQPVSTATDVFSLGVMLYELLAGVHPFRKPDLAPAAIEVAICETTPSRPSVAAREGPAPDRARPLAGDLDTIVLMAIRKEPGRRYDSAAELDEDIRRHLDGLPVAARGEAFGYLASRFISRHRGAVAATGLLLASLVAGLIGTAWQARIARAERDRARTEAIKAERVSRVLQDMLRAPDPGVDGRTVTVAQVLDSASQRIASDLRDEPEVRAAVRTAIGNTYYNLGLDDAAERELREALDLTIAVHGAGSLETARARAELASLLVDEGNLDAADGETMKALAALDALGSHAESDGDRATTLNLRGKIAAHRGQGEEAVRRYREALAIMMPLYGETNAEVAEVKNNLAVQAETRNNLPEAEQLYRDAVRIIRNVKGENHPGYAAGLSNLAGVLHSEGKLDEAGTLYEQALALRIRLLGAEHPDVTFTQLNYADLLYTRGDYRRALALCQQVLARRGSLPPHHPMVAGALVVGGRARLKLGDAVGAERDLREALALRQAALPPGHWLLANTESVLGECLLARGQTREAERLLVSSYTQLAAERGPDHERTKEARARVAALYRATGRPALAAQYSR